MSATDGAPAAGDPRDDTPRPAAPQVTVRRARIEEIRPLAEQYAREGRDVADGAEPWDPPLPQGGIFWLAEDADRTPLGYAAGTLRPSGCVVGPVFTTPQARRRGIGRALLTAIQRWAGSTRVPVVEISVAADNTAGTAFLASLGYVPRRILLSLTPERS